MSVSPHYMDFLERMESYRKRIGLSQTELAIRTGVTQSQISKQRTGRNIVTYEVLHELDKRGGDLNYILTGEKHEKTELDGYYERCAQNRREALLELMLWSLEQSCVLQGAIEYPSKQESGEIRGTAQERSFLTRIEYVRLRMQNEAARKSVWYGLRKAHRLTQQKMADIIRLDIKKYAQIEHGTRMPDAEILLEIYDLWGVAPNVILGKRNGDMQELNVLWKSLSYENRQRVIRTLEFCCDMYLQS